MVAFVERSQTRVQRSKIGCGQRAWSAAPRSDRHVNRVLLDRGQTRLVQVVAERVDYGYIHRKSERCPYLSQKIE